MNRISYKKMSFWIRAILAFFVIFMMEAFRQNLFNPNEPVNYKWCIIISFLLTACIVIVLITKEKKNKNQHKKPVITVSSFLGTVLVPM